MKKGLKMADKNVDMPCKTGSMPEHGSEAEAWALTEAGRRMKVAQEAENQSALLAAVNLNWRLWTIFQAQLLAPGCDVPTEIRNNMVSLSNFVDKVSVGVIRDVESPETKISVDGLIEINRQIASGLLGMASDEDDSVGINYSSLNSKVEREELQHGCS